MASVRRSSKPTPIPFRYIIQLTASGGGLNTVPVNPNSTLSPRLLSIADNFDEYRFTELKFRLHPWYTASPSAADFAVAVFEPGVVDTPPSSPSQASEGLCHVSRAGGTTKPSSWCSVPRPVLKGMHPWYKTVQGTPESAEEVQGNIFVAGPASFVYYIEFAGVCEFNSPISSASTPAARRAAQKLRERNRVMELLAYTEKSSTEAVRRLP